MIRTIRTLAAVACAFALTMCGGTRTDKDAPAAAPTEAAASTAHGHDHGATMTAEDSASYISKRITVSGDVEHELTLTVDSLKAMNVATIEDFAVVCQSGDSTKKDLTCKGVLLKDILDKAAIAQRNHKDRNFYIVARASDGYMATFSWAELYNNPTGAGVYVIFEENGQPIEAQGDMVLISRTDTKTGPRHVYWLKGIEVRRVG